MRELTDEMNTSVYLIDREFHIVHMNATLKKIMPAVAVGDFCYAALCGEDAPCKNCPLMRENYATTVFFNKRRQRWEEVNTGRIEWPGAGECDVLMFREFRKDNKNLLYNLANLSAYDELFELNVTHNAYSVLYHEKDKYQMPDRQGTLEELRRDVSEHMIHPEDKEAFLNFWNLDTLAERVGQECAADGAMKGRFRKRKVDGGWGWVLQSVVPLRGGQQEEQVFLCFIQDIDDWNHAAPSGEAERYSGVDHLTGLLRMRAFYAGVEQLLRRAEDGQYCLVALDIEHFKLFNEWYGREAGDRFLQNIGNHLLRVQSSTGGLAGYMGEDNFVVLLPNEPTILTELQTHITGYMKHYGDHAGFLPAFGVYEVRDRTEAVSTMYDRALVALNAVKGNYAQRVGWYDANMLRQMARDHRLLAEVQQALERREFTFYTQPKCNMNTGKIVGLESLVRWIHPERGVVPPGAFLPLLESNGFITDLDRYIWEEVCRCVRSWLDKGYRPVPVSVNVSRMDIYALDVVSCFRALIEKYELDPSLIELEITESAYVEEYEIIPQVVDRLRKAGFAVSMDDFGSGYSSLNMLKDVQVDILKIDMKFLEMNTQTTGTGVGILEAIIGMARLMGMRFIAEGVETRDHMEFLLNMGCTYGQGYYFYRPMPLEQIEQILADENNMDYRGLEVRRFDHLRIKDLLNENLVSETMMNNILGGIAFYDVFDDRVELLQANEQYYRIVGSDPEDVGGQRKNMLDDIRGRERERLLAVFRRAKDKRPGCAEDDIRRRRGDGAPIWVHLRAFFLREQDGHILCYGSVTDVTVQKQWEEQLQASQRELSAVMGLTAKDESFLRLAEENRKTATAIFAQMTPGGMIGGYCEDGFPLYFANAEIVRLMGYDSYEELYEAIGGMVGNTIHPDDMERVVQDIGPEYYAGLEYTTTYRMPKKDGSWFWTLDKGRVVRAEDGRLAIVSACTDISESMEIQEKLAERNTILLRQNQELQFLNNDIPGGYHRCAKNDEFDLVYMSGRFLEMFGYTRQEIYDLFENKFIRMVHPDDRDVVRQVVKSLHSGDSVCTLEYRMRSKRGYIWVIDQSKHLEYDGTILMQGVVLDVTETVTLRNQMQLLRENTPENIILFNYGDSGRRYEVVANGLVHALGYRRAEFETFLQEKELAKSLRPEDARRLQNALRLAIEKRQDYQDILPLELPRGEHIWVSITFRFVKAEREDVTYLCICHDVTTMKQKERELWLAGRQLESIVRQAGINSWDLDIQEDRLVIHNVQKSEELTAVFPEMREQAAVYDHFSNRLQHWKDDAAADGGEFFCYASMVLAGKAQDGASAEIPIRVEGGRVVWIRTACETIRDDEGQAIRVVGYYTDITREKQEAQEKREIIKTLELLKQKAVYDFKANLTQNTMVVEGQREHWQEESGCSQEESYSNIVTQICGRLVLPQYRSEFYSFADRERLLRAYQDGAWTLSMEYQRLYDNATRWMRMVVHFVQFDDAEDVYAYIFLMDIDEEKQEELRLTRLAETDAMTGLYNRQTAVTRIKAYLAEAADQSAALILFDLDNFKRANDVFGHAYGDQIIIQTAETLKHSFREGDVLCRLGGDEFLVLCKNIREDTVRQKLGQVIDAMHLHLSREGQELEFSTSAGYALIPAQGRDFAELYHKADVALFNVKLVGKGSFAKYDSSMKEVRYELADRN